MSEEEVPLSESAKAELAQLQELLAFNPLVKYNNPDLAITTPSGKWMHTKQLAFHDARTRVKVYTGGTRAGKSSAGAVDDLIQLLPPELVPEHLRKFKRKDPPFKMRVITPDLNHTLASIQEVLRSWCPPSALLGGSWDKAYSKDKRVLRFECGSYVDFMSYETDLDKFGGVALDRIHYDEEPPGDKGHAIWTQGLRRLVDYQGDALLTATPEFGLSWTSTEIWDERGPEIEDRVWQNDWLTLVRASTHDNPFVPADELSESRMTEEEYKVKVLGEWFHLKGLVYGEFDEQKHLVDAPLPSHLQGQEILVGIDPGIRTTAVVFSAFDKDNSMLVFDNLYLHDEAAIPENAAKSIKQKMKKWLVKDPRFVIDPSSRNRSLVNADDVQAAFMREGINATPGQNAVEAGVFEIKRRLQAGQLLISRDCEELVWEIRRYRMDDKSDGTFAVVKQHDHALDAMRYLAMERAWDQRVGTTPPPRRNLAYDPHFQAPYKTERPVKDTPPQGAFA